MSVSAVGTLQPSISVSPSRYFEDWCTTTKVAALKLASYLTDPICKVREYFYTFYILGAMCKSTTQKVARCILLTLGIVACTLITPFTTPLGILVRYVVSRLEAKPYIFIQREGPKKVLPSDRRVTVATHNECYAPAGFAITDGQVTPSSDRGRMDANIRKMKELNPDVVCLYEVPDICDAFYISSQLSEYPFLIPVVGVRAIGPTSMMYVASKYEIDKESIEFTPFVKGTELTGRAKFSERGFLTFDLKSQGSYVATLISTHLQHSEIPAHPLDKDKQARALQMQKIARVIQTKMDKAVIFTGDLNLDEEELTTHQINWLRRDPAVQGLPTWGGDTWCAKLMGKNPSPPKVLDYAFIAGRAIAISTRIIGTGFSDLEFRPKATSDHALLFSTITL